NLNFLNFIQYQLFKLYSLFPHKNLIFYTLITLLHEAIQLQNYLFLYFLLIIIFKFTIHLKFLFNMYLDYRKNKKNKKEEDLYLHNYQQQNQILFLNFLLQNYSHYLRFNNSGDQYLQINYKLIKQALQTMDRKLKVLIIINSHFQIKNQQNNSKFKVQLNQKQTLLFFMLHFNIKKLHQKKYYLYLSQFHHIIMQYKFIHSYLIYSLNFQRINQPLKEEYHNQLLRLAHYKNKLLLPLWLRKQIYKINKDLELFFQLQFKYSIQKEQHYPYNLYINYPYHYHLNFCNSIILLFRNCFLLLFLFLIHLNPYHLQNLQYEQVQKKVKSYFLLKFKQLNHFISLQKLMFFLYQEFQNFMM
ncbi:hypothetical protein IMG5_023710, partial [Ichthyophthirius multifiliis]